ncbi:MAG: exopolysaccharide biosynthesis polyprenyl glycosylphosphotransferase [Devosiaceae bacterium]|nr:exopolysaccharide biosynthesis polyprenyl glycosylphosphotransferase [Devosiaceae bacterium]
MSTVNQPDIEKFEKSHSPSAVSGTSKSFEGLLPLASLLNMLVEFFALIVAGFLSDWLYHRIIYQEPPSELWLLNAVSAATIFVLMQAGTGKYSISWILTRTLSQSHLIRDWMITFSIVLAFSFLSKYSADQSRGAYILFGAFGLLTVFSLRKLTSTLFAQAVKSTQLITRNIVLIGSRTEIQRYYANEKLWEKGIRVAASLTINPNKLSAPADLWISHNQLHVSLASLDRLTSHLRQMPVDDVVLTLPWANTSAIQKILDKVNPLPCAIYLAPDPALDYLKSSIGSQNSLSHALIDPQSGLSGIRIAQRPLTPLARVAKRSFDIVAAATGLLVLSPLLILIAILIRLESPGSPVFLQRRHGFNERPFHIIKFRSMVMNTSNSFTQTRKNDARITRTGAFIRRTNLDELPQLINVLFGSMSLVGPRPHAVAHNDAFMTKIAHYANRHHVKPGITGWAQVNGWRGAATKQNQMAARIEHDLQYINNWSFSLDIKILFFTFFSKKAFHNAF